MSTRSTIYDDQRTHVYTDCACPHFVFIDIDGHGGPDVGLKIPLSAWQRIRQCWFTPTFLVGVKPDAFDRRYAPEDRIQVFFEGRGYDSGEYTQITNPEDAFGPLPGMIDGPVSYDKGES